MKKRWLVLGLLFSLAFNLTFLGMAGYRMWEKQKKRKDFQERVRTQRGQFWNQLQLRPEQKVYLDTLRNQFMPRVRAIRVNLQKERETLNRLMMQDKPDTVQIKKQLGRVVARQTEIDKEVFFHMLKEKESMDPRQREIFLEMIKRRMQGWAPMRGREQPDRQPPPEREPPREGARDRMFRHPEPQREKEQQP